MRGRDSCGRPVGARRKTEKTSKVTAQELDAAMSMIGWRESDLAKRLKCSRSFVGQMRRGERPVPERVARFVLSVVAIVRNIPEYRNF